MSTAPTEENNPSKRLRLDEPSGKDETMKTEETKLEVIEDKDIYFEPRWLCDIKVIYEGQVFHCHRYALVKDSKMLEATLSGDRECKQLEIPQLKNNINSAIITIKEFHDFLIAIHQINAVMQCDTIQLAYLLHYFETNALRSRLEKACLDRKEIGWHTITELTVATEYKWKRKKEIMEHVVEKLPFYMLTFNQSTKYEEMWNYLPMQVQRDIFILYLHKKQLLGITPLLLPTTS
jgi:hypothetical protein